jgi:hypothetical protein
MVQNNYQKKIPLFGDDRHNSRYWHRSGHKQLECRVIADTDTYM